MPDASSQEEAETQDKAKPPAEKSFLGSMAKVASAVMGSGPVRNNPFSGTYVYAQGRAHSEAIKVRKGETTVLSFGPPYNPVVTAYLMGTRPAGRQFPDQMELEMSLIGAAGEVCSNVTHFGNETGGASHRRLPRPHFTIKDPKGKVVHEGDFDENGGAQYRHVWQLEADPAEEYRVSIAVKADLVAINQDYESVLKTAQLQNFGNRNAPAVAAPQGPNRLLVGLSCSGVIVLLAGVLYLKRRFRAA
jgi:hypothetical protein